MRLALHQLKTNEILMNETKFDIKIDKIMRDEIAKTKFN